jgi:hypothetical protein
VATAIITETWPPGGVIPPGFTTPAGPTSAWTVATDQVFEGTNSLRSASPRGNGDFSTFFNSDLSFSGTFTAGTVAFAYRVSSYEGFGLLDFLVDGAVVFSDTGETGWKSFSYQVTAGAHTLIWRFKNSLPFACSGAIPPPQGGAACADRAWIDAVVLPLQLASSTTTLASSRNPSNRNQPVTFTATVAGGAGTPSGIVVFRDGSSVIAGCSVATMTAGVAQCVTSALPLGTRAITAQYSGNATYVSSTSSTLTQTVSAAKMPLSPLLLLLLLN